MNGNKEQVINHYLGKEINTIDDIVADKQGITGQLANALYSGMSVWLILSNVLIVIFSVLLIWSAFKFFTATAIEDYVYWGFCVVLSLQIQIALKQWLWTQIDKSSIIRELKRTQRLHLTNSSH